MNTRAAAVAGYFYPENVDLLRESITTYLGQVENKTVSAKAIIAPHAGYQYSGPIAATAYQSIIHRREQIKRVVILGPAHRVFVTGMALSSASNFVTPLGEIEIDQVTQKSLLNHANISINDEAHCEEHAIEVHLPFLQSILMKFVLVPIVVGEATPEQVSAVISELWDDDTLIIVSSDLSHFLDYEHATQIDHKTAEAITHLNSQSIGPKQACGCRPMNGLLHFAKQNDLTVTTLDLRNSGDTAGDKARVVGYGAFAVS